MERESLRGLWKRCITCVFVQNFGFVSQPTCSNLHLVPHVIISLTICRLFISRMIDRLKFFSSSRLYR